MVNVIITGADGFVGSYTTRYFLDQGIAVLGIGRDETPCRLQTHPLLTYMQLDVGQINELNDRLAANRYDTFIHFAWDGSAGPARNDYNLQMSNAVNTVECMKAAKKLGCSRFVCAGSIMEKEVVAAVNNQGSRPSMPYIYGTGKLMAHHLCKCVAADINIDLIWPMITNAYGEGEFSPRFVNTTIRKITNKEKLQFTAATQNYDFVYITDVARAFYLIAKNGRPFCEYLIGSSNARPLRDFILEMTAALDADVVPEFGDIPFTGIDMPLKTFDTTDTHTDTGFVAEISFSEGIRRTFQWLSTQKG